MTATATATTTAKTTSWVTAYSIRFLFHNSYFWILLCIYVMSCHAKPSHIFFLIILCMVVVDVLFVLFCCCCCCRSHCWDWALLWMFQNCGAHMHIKPTTINFGAQQPFSPPPPSTPSQPQSLPVLSSLLSTSLPLLHVVHLHLRIHFPFRDFLSLLLFCFCSYDIAALVTVIHDCPI